MLKKARHYKCNKINQHNQKKESLSIEYKSVHLLTLQMTDEEAIKCIRNSIWTNKLNECSIISLSNMICNVLPRYIAGCLHKDYTANHCIVNFGINDEGIKEGVLYDGNLRNALNWTNIIKYIFENKILCANKDIIEKYISIKIIKLKKNKENILDEPENSLLNLYELEIKKLEQKQCDYEVKYKAWEKVFRKYMKQLTVLFNEYETRNEFREYILQKNPNSSVIDLIDSNYILEYFNHKEISIEKSNNDSPYTWLCIWRDELMKDILAKKPKKTFNFKPFMTPLKIIQTQTTMIPHWLAKNPKLKRYVIAIKIKKPKLYIGDIQYYDEYSGTYKKTLRTLSPRGDPCCASF